MNETYSILPSPNYKSIALLTFALCPLALAGMAYCFFAGILQADLTSIAAAAVIVAAVLVLAACGVYFLNKSKETLILDYAGAHYANLFGEKDLRWAEIRDYGFYELQKDSNGNIIRAIYLSTKPLDKNDIKKAAKAADIHFVPGLENGQINFEAFRIYCRNKIEGKM